MTVARRRSIYRLSGIFLAFLASLVPIASLIAARAQQLDCSDVVKAALQMTGTHCDQISRNKACYGNFLVAATANDGVPGDSFVFQKPGDIVDVGNLHTLRLAPYDAKSKQWGIAYLRIQANLPDTTAGQYVTMLMFGDTAIRDQSQMVSTADNVVNPMQAVYFRTGVGSPACHTAPTSGLIIQAPKGAQPVKMTVDGVQLGISSTVLLESSADDLDAEQPIYPPLAAGATASATLTPSSTPPPTNTPRYSHPTSIPHYLKISTIEGHVTVSHNGHTVTIGSGQQSSIALTDDSSQPLDEATPSPAQSDFGIQTFVKLLLQPGVDNVLLTPTETFTPRPTLIGLLPRETSTIMPPATNTPGTSTPPNTPLPPTITYTPSITFTPSNTYTLSNTYTATNTSTATFTSTFTPTSTPTHTPTFTATFTSTSTPPPANEVTTLAASGPGSLSAVVANTANSSVIFAPGLTGVISVTAPMPINRNLTITGTSTWALTVNASGNQIFAISGASNVSISGLTMTNGNAGSVAGGAVSVGAGSTVTLSNDTFQNNGAANGGAVANNGTLIVSGCTFSANNATNGGAIYNSGNASITNSTFGGNSATSGGAIYDAGSLSLTNSTVSGNSGGGLRANATTIQQSIVSGNSSPNISGTITSLGYNLLGEVTNGALGTDIVNNSPNLYSLNSYGGVTQTMPPHGSSPAVGSAAPTCATGSDQRGVSRSTPCTIGAVQYNGSPA